LVNGKGVGFTNPCTNAQRFAVAAAGDKKNRKRETAKAKKKAQKRARTAPSRPLDAVLGVTFCLTAVLLRCDAQAPQCLWRLRFVDYLRKFLNRQ